MLRKLCLSSASILIFFIPQPARAISGNSCSVTVNGSVNTPVNQFTACTTISTLINPNINFVSGTPMPPGMLITKSSSSGGSATWQISGTPSSAGTGTAVYSFTDTNPGSVTLTVNYNILAPVVPAGTMSAGTAGRPYPATTVTATGGTNSGFSFSVTAGALPPGLSLASGGGLSGTTTTAGTYNFTIQATDSGLNTGSAAFSITVNAAVSMAATASLNRTVGQTYTGSFVATGGTAPIAYAVSAGTIAPGAALGAANGTLSGTASAPANATFTVTATDANGSAASTVVTYVISPVPVISLSTPSATMGTPYSQTITFTGAISAATLASGALPGGLSLTGGNTISGTPTATGTFSFTLAGTDSNGVAASANFSILVTGALTIMTTTLPPGNFNATYNATIATMGGTAPIALTVSSGTLPPGLSLSSGGMISGTATAPGSFAFTVQATDALNATVSQPFTIAITAPPLVLSTTTLPGASQGTPYSANLVASGGAGTLTFAVTNGLLPAGITLSAQGLFAGTPTATGTFNFTVAVTDAFSNSVSRAMLIQVTAPPIVFTTTALGSGSIGSPYSAAIAASGGAGPLTFSVTAGSLPAGLALSASGQITGTPSATGTANFTVTAVDSFSNSNSRAYSITVISPITIITASQLPPATVGAAVNLSIQASGGTAPLQWTVLSGSPAAGLQLIGGVLSGVPTQASIASFTVQVTDANGATASATFSQTVNPLLEITNLNLGGPYSRNGYINHLMAASGGTLPLQWSIAIGPLPPGISLNPNTGRIQGAFQGTGSFPLTLRVQDAVGAVATKQFVLAITDGPQFGNVTLTAATAGFPYRSVLEVFSTLPIVEWMIGTPQTFPPGLQLVDRMLVGTPSTPGSYDFEISVRDQSGSSAVGRFLFVVNPPLQLLEATEPTGFVRGTPMRWTLPRVGGTPPFRFQLLNGVFPNGLSLDAATGVISGTPLSSGEFPFTVGVTDANEATANRLYRLQSGGRFQILDESLPKTLALGLDYRRRIDVEGGVPPYQLRLSEGSLPPGLTLDSGSVFGRPVQAGAYPVAIVATDATGATTTARFSILVTNGIESQPKSLHFIALSGGRLGIPQTLKLIATGVGNAIRIHPGAPWLRVSSPSARAPGFVDVWVDPALLPQGTSSTELILTAGTVTTRLPVRVEVLPEDPASWWFDFLKVPGGNWAALLQANASPVPFQASIPAAADAFRLSDTKGEILGPESFLLMLERANRGPGMSRSFHLTVQNLSSGEQQVVEIPEEIPPIYEVSSEWVRLRAQAGASRSSSASVVVAASTGQPMRVAALASAPWLDMQVAQLQGGSSARITFSARPSALAEGVHTAFADLYDSTGVRFQTIEVQLQVSSLAPPVELSTRALTLDPRMSRQSIRLHHPSPFPVSYSATTSSTLLRLENAAGEVPAGGEVLIHVSAAEGAFTHWTRHSVILSFGDGTTEIIEVDLAMREAGGACPSDSPVLSFLSPGPGFAVRLDQPVSLRVAVRNGCGQPAGGAAIVIKVPGEGPIPLYPGPDGVWENVWYPSIPAEGILLEANWLDPARRRSVSRNLSGAVQP